MASKETITRKNITSIDLTEYLDIIDEDHISALEVLSPLRKFDATFIRKVIFSLYSEASVMSDIPSYNKGIKYNRGHFPEEIKNVIHGMFTKRLEKHARDDQDFVRRLRMEKSHISNALSYLIRNKKSELNFVVT